MGKSYYCSRSPRDLEQDRMLVPTSGERNCRCDRTATGGTVTPTGNVSPS